MIQNGKKTSFNHSQMLIWLAALLIGGFIGYLNIGKLNELCNLIAEIYTRLFKLIAVPTIALAIMTTLAQLGAKKSTGKIFLHTITYTLMTTVAAAIIGAVLFKIIAPQNIPVAMCQEGTESIAAYQSTNLYDHILRIVPDNILTPFATGNVLSILLVSAVIGIAIARMKQSENIQILLKGILGLQDVLFAIINGLIWTLPLGIIAFAAQFTTQMSTGVIVGSLGKYVAVILIGNLLQFFVVLPLFLLTKKINPLRVFRNMLPAVLMALFTKSSAATLPVTVECAENNMNAKPAVARFILPICCTINMNGCAAFILVTSLFVMQNGGIQLTTGTLLVMILLSVVSAIGNAGVPMGCYFLTLSLMSGMQNAPLWIMGIILPVYTVIDMIETAVNVWSDSCVCAIVDKKLLHDDI